SPTVLVGYDTRFASEHFGREAARVLSSQNIRARLCVQAVPTPAVAWTIIEQKFFGAVNITASHNPGEYNGLKFSTPDGAPALPEVTKAIEQEIAAVNLSGTDGAGEEEVASEDVDGRPSYLKRLSELVDLSAIKKSGISVVF